MGLGLYVLIGVISLFAVAWTADAVLESWGVEVAAGTIGLSIRNAVHPIAWGIATALIALPIGRRLVPGICATGVGWSLLGTGVVLASLTTFLVQEFVRARFVWFDPEYAGFTIFTAPAIVAIGLAGWATIAVPREAGRVPAATALLAVMGLAISLLPSIEGARDGIDADSIPLVVVLGLDVAYATVVALLIARRATR